MGGLAFPSEAVYREVSYDRENGTPHRNDDDAIPIDPALSGPAIDPAIMREENGIIEIQAEPPVFSEQMRAPEQAQQARQYSQGPQGDPFAPQPTAPYFPDEEEPMATPKPIRRKRRPRKEPECGFCQGSDAKNKDGASEAMVSCDECGRSGHPSCMELGDVCDVVRSYPWRCTECKICEICQLKGDDERILFCDYCDRGWHMDCLQPPLEESPPGSWHCPMCPPLDPDPDTEMEYYTSNPESSHLTHETYGQSSDPSSSRQRAPNGHKRKGRQKGVASEEEDSDVDMVEEEAEAEVHIQRAAPKNRRKRRPSKKTRAQYDSDEDEPASPVINKRSRLRAASPVTPKPRMVVRLRIPGKGKEREDEEQKGLFEDILGVADRDTAKTTVENGDKMKFERSRMIAEEKLAPPAPPPPPDLAEVFHAGSLYRPTRSSALHHISLPINASTPGMSTSPAPSTPGPGIAAAPAGLRIRTIRFGEYDIQTWYDAPFPEEYANIPDGRMWICEFCLKYMKSRFGAVRHRMKCKARHPPGDEIYRDGGISVFEVDGRKNKIYCQNLCLLSKMFLDHKSLFYDVEPFLFYVMTEVDDTGARFVGYFSKEKRSPKDYNVSCIMTLPVRQRQGWGNLLIDFSYLLSKKEQRSGSPEKPLSGLGALGYRNYWTLALMRYLDVAPDMPRLEGISAGTSMTIEDIHTTLTQQNMIFAREMTPPPVRPSPGQSIKFPKGRKHGIARRHLQRTQTNDDPDTAVKAPFIPPTHYEIRWDRDKVTHYLATWEAKGYLTLKPEKLKWSPFLVTRVKKSEGLQALADAAAELSSRVDAVSLDETPAPSNEPTTPSNGTRHPSVSLFGDSVGTSDSNAVPPTFGEESESALPVIEPYMQQEQSQTPSPKVEHTPARQTHKPTNGSTIQSFNGQLSARKNRSRSASQAEQSWADDEALAAKLALEERPATRSLRTRADESPDLKRTLSSASATRLAKRRRVESSPESEVGSPPGIDMTPRHNVVPSTPRLKPTSVKNGVLRVLSPTHNHVVPSIQTQLAYRADEVSIDIKAEAVTTPLTGLTSLHSLPPSEDTVVTGDITDVKQQDTSLDPDVQMCEITQDINGKPIDATVGYENDAEGDEDDADADGELDAEGELDADDDAEEILF